MKYPHQLRRTIKISRTLAAGPYRVGVISAGVLALGLTSGVLLNQAAGQPGALKNGPDTVAVAELNLPEDQAAASPAESTPAPEAATAAPSSAAPSPAESTSAPAEAKKAAEQPAEPAPKAPPAAKSLDIDYQAQINGWYCGPAATRIALTARDRGPSQDEVAAALGTTFNGTNSADDVTRGLNRLADTDFYSSTFIDGAPSPAQMDQLQADVVHAVSNGYAVVANIVGSATDVDGGWHQYDGGHYLTVVGYKDEGRLVQIADPAYVNGVSEYWMTTIDLANWMATRGYSS